MTVTQETDPSWKGFSDNKHPVPEPAYFGAGMMVFIWVMYFFISHRNKRASNTARDENSRSI